MATRYPPPPAGNPTQGQRYDQGLRTAGILPASATGGTPVLPRHAEPARGDGAYHETQDQRRD